MEFITQGQEHIKIRDQRPTFRRHTLSRPKTGMLRPRTQRARKKVFAQKNRKLSRYFRHSQKKRSSLSARFLAFSKTKKKKGHDLRPWPIFNESKIVLSSTEDRAFRELEGYEAKELTFEAKDFKNMCPRGLYSTSAVIHELFD